MLFFWKQLFPSIWTESFYWTFFFHMITMKATFPLKLQKGKTVSDWSNQNVHQHPDWWKFLRLCLSLLTQNFCFLQNISPNTAVIAWVLKDIPGEKWKSETGHKEDMGKASSAFRPHLCSPDFSPWWSSSPGSGCTQMKSGLARRFSSRHNATPTDSILFTTVTALRTQLRDEVPRHHQAARQIPALLLRTQRWKWGQGTAWLGLPPLSFGDVPPHALYQAETVVVWFSGWSICSWVCGF